MELMRSVVRGRGSLSLQQMLSHHLSSLGTRPIQDQLHLICRILNKIGSAFL
jgi:hypothetical protein